MSIRTAAILFGLVGIAGVAVYYYEHQISILQDLTYQVIAFNLTNISGDLATINLTVRIMSSSTLDATVKGLYIDLYVNGIKLGSITSSKHFVIPARSTTGIPGYSDVPLQLNFSPKLLLGNVLGLVVGITNTQDFTIDLIGYVQIKEAFLNISVPFTYSTTLKQILQP